MFVNHFVVENSVFLGQQNIGGTALDIIEANAQAVFFVNNEFGNYRGLIKTSDNVSIYAYVGGAVIANQSMQCHYHREQVSRQQCRNR